MSAEPRPDSPSPQTFNAAPATASTSLPLASLPRRLAAVLYDALLLTGALFVAAAVVMGLVVLMLGSEQVQRHDPLRGNPWFSTYLFFICFFFYAGFWTHGGQTLGLRAWRLRVQGRDGRGISWWQALLRFLTGGLWLLPILYLHATLGIGLNPSLGAGLVCLLLMLALRLPDRASETELRLLPKIKR
jgi:uncharacterized RDD family membrane protein YckC